MTSNGRSLVTLVGLLLLLATGCGTQNAPGRGYVIVEGLASGQELLCGVEGQTVTVAGSGFQSEHGIDVVVRYTATSGTPFNGGTSASEDVLGRALSDTEIEVPLPSVNLGTTNLTITVILPGGNYGVSPPQDLVLGGQLLGPFANFDQYDATGNVPLVVAAATGVLLNDTPIFCGEPGDDVVEPEKPAPDGPVLRQGEIAVVGFDTVSARGGTVAMNPDGSFAYEPPLGVGGTALQPEFDSFLYTIEQDGQQDIGFVEIAIREVVWFIDDAAAPGGSGRFSDPFDGLPAFNAVQGGGADDQPEPGDWIFVYRGSAPYDDGIVLLDSQKLIGQGVDLVVNGQVIVTATEPPALTNTGLTQGLDCIVLANANRIDGADVFQPFGNGIRGTNVSGPTTVDHCAILGAAQNGILLEGDCTGTFDFGPTVGVVDAGYTGVRINGFGEQEQLPSPEVQAQVFDGVFTYEGTISQTDAGAAIVVGFTTPGSAVVFQNGAIDFDNGEGFVFAAIDLFEIQGTFTCTSPQTIQGTPFIGILVEFSPGTFTFMDTTIDVLDNGFSGSGIEGLEVGAATIGFTNLDIDIAGDNESSAGGVGIRIGNLGETTSKPAPRGTSAVGPTSLSVDGNATIDMIDAEEACVIFGDGLSPVVLDMTFQTISVDGSPQTGGFTFGQCQGSFEVTGTTTVTNYGSAGLLFLGGDCDLTFATLNLSNATGIAGRGVEFVSNAGMFTVNGGTWDNLTLDAVILQNSNGTINDVAFSNVGVNVIELVGTCTVAGSGNTATGFGNLCDSAGATVTGSISFTSPAATCP